jgi:hypothetical protein
LKPNDVHSLHYTAITTQSNLNFILLFKKVKIKNYPKNCVLLLLRCLSAKKQPPCATRTEGCAVAVLMNRQRAEGVG